jgi:hypothetical protein
MREYNIDVKMARGGGPVTAFYKHCDKPLVSINNGKILG